MLGEGIFPLGCGNEGAGPRLDRLCPPGPTAKGQGRKGSAAKPPGKAGNTALPGNRLCRIPAKR